MKFVRQSKKLHVRNFDNPLEEKDRKISVLLPNNVRCLIVGGSGLAETSLTLNLLFDPNRLCFENVYVFSKSLYQPKYKFLEKVLSAVPEINYYKFSENEQVIHPDEIKLNSLIIFDDVACEQQDNIRSHFAICRHKENNVIYETLSCNVIYICLTYVRTPKNLIRDNANLIIVFQQDELNLKYIYRDHVNTDKSFETFKEICSKVWTMNELWSKR